VLSAASVVCPECSTLPGYFLQDVSGSRTRIGTAAQHAAMFGLLRRPVTISVRPLPTSRTGMLHS
jgi:hypothetical protein